jgi:hypothetical protein
MYNDNEQLSDEINSSLKGQCHETNNCFEGLKNQISISVHALMVFNLFFILKRYCLMAREGGGEWYQSISFNKLSCRQVSFFGPKGTPSREEPKTPGSVLTTFIGALTNWCRKIRQNVSPYEHSKY